MKKILIIILLFNCFLSFSQNDSICNILPSKDGKVCYESVVQIDKSSGAQIYSNSKIWIGNTFKNAKAVIQSDVENSSLVIKGNIKEDQYSIYTFTLTLQFKDGRYKYTFTDIHSIFTMGTEIDKKIEDLPALSSCKKNTLLKMDLIFNSFLNSMKNGLSKNNDW